MAIESSRLTQRCRNLGSCPHPHFCSAKFSRRQHTPTKRAGIEKEVEGNALLQHLWFANNPSALISRCDPFIPMVKTAEFRDFDDRAMFHDLTLDRAFLFQSQVRT